MKIKIDGPINLKFNYHKDLMPPTTTRLKYLREQVERIKKMPQPEQRTEAWYSMREERITASDFATALGESPYSDRNKLLLKKVTKDRVFNVNKAILWGVKYEEVAVMIYEYRNSVNVVEYGCIRHPYYNWLGASPDGITDDGVMLEIKCPSSRQITGIIPSYYWCQVQGQLEVCELDRCDFLECKLEEYESRELYEADNYEGNYFLNSLGKEKGIVIEYFKVDTKSYSFDYLPLGLIGEELDKAINESKRKNVSENKLFSSVDYWKLKEISCIPIYRNQEWFHSKVPVFRAFWDDVLKFRKLGSEACKKFIESEKARKKKEKLEARGLLKKSTNKKSSPKTSKKFEKILITDFIDSVTKEEVFVGFEDNNDKEKKNKKDVAIVELNMAKMEAKPILKFSSNKNYFDEILDTEENKISKPKMKFKFSNNNFHIDDLETKNTKTNTKTKTKTKPKKNSKYNFGFSNKNFY